ncbi:hypothetical protein HPP92_016199 [Vanilla planifolia]|uniref:Uncharacterized protein n=1 Tax=Vanilla planifolia TaxID=51239 RepID=A0A835URV5_VANPL|nr:hypothetical protein HPP92_016199 [Vanilla planifolia]
MSSAKGLEHLRVIFFAQRKPTDCRAHSTGQFRFRRSGKKHLSVSKIDVSSTKFWIIAGVGVAGVLIIAETARRRRKGSRKNSARGKDFGAFVERFELHPAPQPSPPAARHPLSDLTFAVGDNFDVKNLISGFGNPDWKRTHEAASKTAVVVSLLLSEVQHALGGRSWMSWLLDFDHELSFNCFE